MDRQKMFDFYNEQIFTNGNMIFNSEIDSVNFHAMTHEDTEILGMFCDFTGIHGSGLKRILIEGLLYEYENATLIIKEGF